MARNIDREVQLGLGIATASVRSAERGGKRSNGRLHRESNALRVQPRSSAADYDTRGTGTLNDQRQDQDLVVVSFD